MAVKKIKFAKVYPMGNLTILIDNSLSTIPENKYTYISQQLLDKNSFICEQIGFFQRKKDKLELSMMGGELCINAIRSLGYMDYFQNDNPSPKIMTRGYSNVYKMDIEGSHTETFFQMQIYWKDFSNTLSIIELNGISYFVEEFPYSEISNETVKTRFNTLLTKYKVQIKDFIAIGYIPFHKHSKEKRYTIKPLVFVRETNSMVFETACGSGTIAAVVHEFYNKGNNDSPYIVTQPSGNDFIVNIKPLDNNNFSIQISSQIKMISEGYIYADENYQII